LDRGVFYGSSERESAGIDMVWSLAAVCVGVVLLSMVGGFVPLATLLTHTRLQLYLSFSAGTMLGAVFFHMLPEAVELRGSGSLRWASMGLLGLFFLERFFAFHHHEAPAVADDPCPEHAHGGHGHGLPGHSAGLVDPSVPGGGATAAKGQTLVWGIAAFGLAVHTIVGGVALASTAQAGTGAQRMAALWSVGLATLLHKPADAMTIVSLMLRAGVSRRTTHLVNFGFALMLPLGVLLFFGGLKLFGGMEAAGSAFTGDCLAFSAGTFLYIALSDLLPELQFHAHDRLKLSASLLCGFGLMILTANEGH
jgi:zinc and cadmium transporter